MSPGAPARAKAYEMSMPMADGGMAQDIRKGMGRAFANGDYKRMGLPNSVGRFLSEGVGETAGAVMFGNTDGTPAFPKAIGDQLRQFGEGSTKTVGETVNGVIGRGAHGAASSVLPAGVVNAATKSINPALGAGAAASPAAPAAPAAAASGGGWEQYLPYLAAGSLGLGGLGLGAYALSGSNEEEEPKVAGFGGDVLAGAKAMGNDALSAVQNFKPTEALEAGLGAVSDNVINPVRNSGTLGSLAAGSPGQPFWAQPWFLPGAIGAAGAGAVGGNALAGYVNKNMREKQVKDELESAEDRYLDALADLHIKKTAGTLWKFSETAEKALRDLYEKCALDGKSPFSSLYNAVAPNTNPFNLANGMTPEGPTATPEPTPPGSMMSLRDTSRTQHTLGSDLADAARAIYLPYAATAFSIPAALSAYYTHKFVKNRARDTSPRRRIERAMKLRDLENKKYDPESPPLIVQ
jgi:hypothetical protein